jgi:hypothetical protein
MAYEQLARAADTLENAKSELAALVQRQDLGVYEGQGVPRILKALDDAIHSILSVSYLTGPHGHDPMPSYEKCSNCEYWRIK